MGRFSRSCLTDPELLDLISKMFSLEPQGRPTCEMILSHPWLAPRLGTPVTTSHDESHDGKIEYPPRSLPTIKNEKDDTEMDCPPDEDWESISATTSSATPMTLLKKKEETDELDAASLPSTENHALKSSFLPFLERRIFLHLFSSF